MNKINRFYKQTALLILGLLLFSSSPAQSQVMDHSAMDMERDEMKSSEMDGMKNMQDIGEMKKADAMTVMKGKMIFQMSCFLCHGRKGKGDGPVSMFIGPYSHPRPNNFTSGIFKFRST